MFCIALFLNIHLLIFRSLSCYSTTDTLCTPWTCDLNESMTHRNWDAPYTVHTSLLPATYWVKPCIINRVQSLWQPGPRQKVRSQRKSKDAHTGVFPCFTFVRFETFSFFLFHGLGPSYPPVQDLPSELHLPTFIACYCVFFSFLRLLSVHLTSYLLCTCVCSSFYIQVYST